MPKQANIDKILKVIQRKIVKGTHLLVEIKEIQAKYLTSTHFKDIYLCLSQNKLPTSETVYEGRNVSIKVYYVRFPII